MQIETRQYIPTTINIPNHAHMSINPQDNAHLVSTNAKVMPIWGWHQPELTHLSTKYAHANKNLSDQAHSDSFVKTTHPDSDDILTWCQSVAADSQTEPHCSCTQTCRMKAIKVLVNTENTFSSNHIQKNNWTPKQKDINNNIKK